MLKAYLSKDTIYQLISKIHILHLWHFQKVGQLPQNHDYIFLSVFSSSIVTLPEQLRFNQVTLDFNFLTVEGVKRLGAHTVTSLSQAKQVFPLAWEVE